MEEANINTARKDEQQVYECNFQNKNEVLQYAVENSIIDLAYVQEMIEMQKRKEMLEMHPYKIWKGKDGKWYTYLPDDEKGRVRKKRNTKSEIENLIIAYWNAKKDNPTIKEVFYDWLDDKLQFGEIGKATYDRYEVDFNKFFANVSNVKIKNVEEDELENFIKGSIKEFGMTAKCFSNFRTLIFGIFKRAKKRKYISFSITELMKDMEISNKSFKKVIKFASEQIFNSNEKQLMEEYFENNIDILNLGLLLMFKTGLRIGELATIKSNEIQDYAIPINRTETRFRGEDGKWHYEVKELPKSEAGIRFGIIPEKYKWILDKIFELNPDGEYLFEKEGHRVKTYSFRRRLRYVCEEKVCINPKSPHKVRKTYGTILLDGKVRESTVIEAMGHSDISVTKNHYYFDRTGIEEKRKELGAIKEL